MSKYYNQPKGDHIYIIVNSSWPHWIKIGETKSISKRMNQYQTGSPFRNYYVFYCTKTNKARQIARYFADNCAGLHEWFKMSPYMAQEIIAKLINGEKVDLHILNYKIYPICEHFTNKDDERN